MLFPDPSCIANETILKLKERGIYRLIGADWVAIATISFRGAIYLDAWEDLNGVDGQIPQEFLENSKHRLSDGESMENVFYRGIYILVIRFRETDKYACYNIYCRKDGPFEEKDIIWLKSYSKVNLEITRLNNEVIQNQELIGAVFNSISSAVLALQIDGSLLLSNQYAIDMFDLPTEYVGRNFFSFFDDAASTQIAQTIIDLAEGKNCATGKNLTIYHETKQKIFHFVISPLKNSKEQISGAVMVVQDVTRQKMMELELEQLRQFGVLGDIAAGLAHDIKNPLMNIMGCSKIALSNTCTEQTRMESMRIIQYSASRIDAVVDQMLSYGRIEGSQVSDIDLNAAISACVTMTERQKFDRLVKIDVDLDQTTPKIRANSIHIQQIFLNVLLNAMQAIQQSGEIHVKSCYDSQQQMIEVAITDTGSGIPAELGDKIFNPYVTTKRTGTGLGLFIVKQTLEKYGGQISISSKDQKTVCLIRLPVSKQAEGR